jgi:hypothetical protein
MKFKIGDHLQEIGSTDHGIVTVQRRNWLDRNWYLIENDELELVNHWVPESNLELHKRPLREQKLEQLGIK